MSVPTVAAPAGPEAIAALDALLSRATWLPFSHLPGVDAAQARGWQAHLVRQRLREDSGATLIATRAQHPTGILLLHALPWDSGVLGLPMGRVALCAGADAETKHALLRAAVAHARVCGWQAMDVQVPVNDLDTLAAASAAGFRLLTTHLALVWDLREELPAIPDVAAARLRPATAADAEAVAEAARRAVDPNSRFLLDRALPAGAAERVFAAWGGNGPRGYADLTQVVERAGEVIGYCNWKRHTAAEAYLGCGVVNLDLIGTVPEARGGGVLTALAAAGLRHWQAAGLRHAEVVTHVLNTGMQRACGGILGARTLAARHTLHWHAA
jgi:L-amino acid N-acyltransferase YncA